MNLGLTGPLNPLQPGNAAPGARLPSSPPALGREAAGSGVFVAAAGPAGRGGRGGRLASGAPGPPFVTPPPSALPHSLPPSAARSPAFVLYSVGRPASLGRGAAARSCPGGLGVRRRPGASRPEGLRLTGARGPHRLGLETVERRGPATPRSGSRPARGAQGSQRRSGLGIGGSG